MAESKYDRANARRPVRSFRTSPDLAEALDRKAADAGLSTAGYVQRVVERDVKGSSD